MHFSRLKLPCLFRIELVKIGSAAELHQLSLVSLCRSRNFVVSCSMGRFPKWITFFTFPRKFSYLNAENLSRGPKLSTSIGKWMTMTLCTLRHKKLFTYNFAHFDTKAFNNVVTKFKFSIFTTFSGSHNTRMDMHGNKKHCKCFIGRISRKRRGLVSRVKTVKTAAAIFGISLDKILVYSSHTFVKVFLLLCKRSFCIGQVSQAVINFFTIPRNTKNSNKNNNN